MPFLGQAMGVFEGCAGHAQGFCGSVHSPRKGRFRALNRFTKRGCGIIGRFNRRGAYQMAQRHALAFAKPQF